MVKLKEQKLCEALLTPREASIVLEDRGDYARIARTLRQKPGFIDRLVAEYYGKGAYDEDEGSPTYKVVKLIIDAWGEGEGCCMKAREALFKAALPSLRRFWGDDADEKLLRKHYHQKPEAWLVVFMLDFYDGKPQESLYQRTLGTRIGKRELILFAVDIAEDADAVPVGQSVAEAA